MVVNPAKAEAMESDSGTGMPASIEAAWGLRERPGKGPKPGLSLQRIIDAAVRVAGSDGFAAVSMNRVAKELGASPMALYRYVTAKDELVDLMLDAAIGAPPAPPAQDMGWRAVLSQWCQALLAAFRRNPWTLRVSVTMPPATPNQLTWMEQGLSALRDTGLTEGEKVSVIMLLSNYVRSTEAMFSGIADAFQASGSSAEEIMSSYGRFLSKVIDPQRFPALSVSVEAGVFDQPDDDPDSEFVFGLERVLDGIETLIRTRA